MAIADLLYGFLIYPVIFILPAWIANGTPVIFGGGKPLDMGRHIFGNHKTWRGTTSGLIGGFIIASLEYVFFSQPLMLGFAITVGAIVGDLAGSFLKRRAHVKEGVNVPILDQYSFFVVAILFSLPYGGLPGLVGLAVIVVLTGVLHRGTNIMAHRARIKKVPW